MLVDISDPMLQINEVSLPKAFGLISKKIYGQTTTLKSEVLYKPWQKNLRT